MNESDLLAAVLSVCKLYGWRTLHIRPARTEKGWRSALQGDGVGWPDLLMVRVRILAVELKSDTGQVTDAQDNWLNVLTRAGVETHVWRPADWHSGLILRTLSGTKKEDQP